MKKSCEAVLLILMLFAAQVNAFAGKDDTVKNLLDTLDAALKQRQTIIDQKVAEAKELSQNIAKLPSGPNLVKGYADVCHAYMHIDGDSTVAYALKEFREASSVNSPALILSSRFDLLRAYTLRGDLAQAYEVISDIGDIDDIDSTQKERYALLLMDFYTHMQSHGDDYSMPTQTASETWNYLKAYVVKDSAPYFFFQTICGGGDCDVDKVVAELAKFKYPSYDYATLAVVVAKLFNNKGNEDKYYEYLIRSAICDARLGNVEVSSLLFLMQTPLLQHDTKRSYAYAQILVDNVLKYHDKNRALKVVEIQDRINKQFNHEKNICVIGAAVAAILFLLALVFSMIKSRMIGRQRKRGKEVKD